MKCSCRSLVRSLGFQPKKEGSIPSWSTMKDLSLEEVEKTLKAFYGDDMSHYVGEGISAWTFKTGSGKRSMMLTTGDGGARELLKALIKETELWRQSGRL